jgi:hypothetical protein
MEQLNVDQLEAEESMFVQTARSVTSSGQVIVLHDVTPATIYFSDRPQRVVGHMTTADFVGLWGEGENSFASDPPNAVLSFVDSRAEAPAEVVVVITDPVLDGQQLSYSVASLDGVIPEAGGPVTLFIDPFGRPLSPVSVCGVRRRERRRSRRRF